jgi:glucose-6-phosphate dehydrogenase assembly protein OpcA
MLRQARWREAIASAFDRPELRPYLGGIRSITVRYAAHPGARTGGTNVIKPLYHVAWLASRLGMAVVEPLRSATDLGDAAGLGTPLAATLRAGRRHIPVSLIPVESAMPSGTTLAVEISARRRFGTLEVGVAAEADAVIVRAALDGRAQPARRFMAPRRTEVELLAETVESVGHDAVATAALLTAARLAGLARG